MQYNNVGKSGLKVSELGLGSWLTVGGYVTEETAISIIHKAYDLGINFFDTANIYRAGEAEKIVGKALKSFSRDTFVLGTKVYWPMGKDPNQRGLSRKHIIEQCNNSLQRLNMEYIDIYYCHKYDNNTPLEETLRAMDDLVKQGKILYIGISNWNSEQITEAMNIVDKYLLNRIIVNQPQYNMFHRDIEKNIIPLCNNFGIGQVVYSPLAQGVLTGKYRISEDMPINSRYSNLEDNKSIQNLLTQQNLEKINRLHEIAIYENISLSQLALSWILNNKNVSSALIGASSPEQVEHNIMASKIVLSNEVKERINNILSNTFVENKDVESSNNNSVVQEQ